MPKVRKYQFDMESVNLTPKNLKQYDTVVIATAHDQYDYEMIVNNAQLVIDTRNATKEVKNNRDRIVKA